MPFRLTHNIALSTRATLLTLLLVATLTVSAASGAEKRVEDSLRKLRRWNCALLMANAILIPVSVGVIGASAVYVRSSRTAFEQNRFGDPEPLANLTFFSDWPKFDEAGNPHIGRGFYLDIDVIESRLSAEERARLDDPASNWRVITKMFAARLTGNAEEFDDSKPRVASSLFEGSGQPGGVCRHRSTVLAGILNHYKIRARTRSGWLGRSDTREPPNHVWTELVDYGYVSDPTNLVLLEEKDRYLRKLLSFYGDGRRIIKVNPRD